MKNETRAHYERLSEIVSGQELKRLFSLFAAAEGEHIERLVVLDRNMKTVHDKDLVGLAEGACALGPQMDLLQVAETMKDDADGCRFAEQEEKETIDFFGALSSQAGSEEMKKVCNLLADKEREHLKMIEEIYFFVEDPRTFLASGEFSNLKSL
jgi:rubrerythrin